VKGKAPWGSLALDPRVQGVFLLFFAATVLLTRLGLSGMANYDDCFYAQKAKEMLRGGSLWLPTFAGEAAFDNPPFFFWLEVLSYKVFGVTVYAAQFPSAFLGVLAVLLTFRLGDKLFAPPVGFYSAMVLSTTLLFTKYARHAMVDAPLCCLVLLGLLAFWEGVHRDKRWFLLWGLSCGAAVLTKSVLGLFLPLISVLWLLVTGKGREILRPWFLAGGLLAVGVGGSWYLVEYLAYGDAFLHRHFGWLVLKRGFQAEAGPWWGPLFYLQDLATFYWPWLPFLGIGTVLIFRRGWHRRPGARLALIWIGTYFLVMSLMGTRSHWYVLPAYPALGMIVGTALADLLKGRWASRGPQWALGAGMVAVFLVNFLPIPTDREREKGVRELSPYVRHFAGQGAKLLCYREKYNTLNNPLLFFTDHAVPKEGFLQSPAEVGREFAAKGVVLCFVRPKDREGLTREVKAWYLLKGTVEWDLLSNRPLGTGEIRTGGDPWEN